MNIHKKPPLVSITRLESYEPAHVRKALEELLEPLGGMKSFVEKGGEAMLKPNFLKASSPEGLVNPHPDLIRAVAFSALDAGAKNAVMVDSPAVGSLRKCARKLGFTEEEIFTWEELDEAVEMNSKSGQFKKIKLARRLVEAESIINIAKAKTHGQMVLTLAVKNMFGAVVGLEKAQWHLRAGRDYATFAKLMVEIHEMVKPRVSILDAVTAMEGNGPGNGDPRQLGFLMASENAHALDTVFCRIIGIDPLKVFTVNEAMKMGLAPSVDEIQVEGPDPESLRPHPPLKMAAPLNLDSFGPVPRVFINMFDRYLEVRPHVDEKKCTMCGECAKVCAAGAMTLDKKKKIAVLDKKKCISCFCCQEVCPEGAITVSAGWLARMLGLGTTPH